MKISKGDNKISQVWAAIGNHSDAAGHFTSAIIGRQLPEIRTPYIWHCISMLKMADYIALVKRSRTNVYRITTTGKKYLGQKILHTRGNIVMAVGAPAEVDDREVCECCGENFKHPGFRKLCYDCWANNTDYRPIFAF